MKEGNNDVINEKYGFPLNYCDPQFLDFYENGSSGHRG